MDGLLSLVIPVYNEADSLTPLVAEIDEALAAYGSPYEIVFVDDGSTDGSYAVMKGLAEARDDVRVVKLRRNFGKAAALSHGFAAARGDYLVTMDGDRQDDPAEIPNLTAPLLEGYDLVSGWKQRRQDPLNKTLPSRFFNWTVRRASGIPLHDFNCGLKAYRRDVIDTDLHLRRAPPLHPGGRRAGRLPGDGGQGEPPPSHRRPLQVRVAAVHARLPRPADGHVPRPLPAPAAAPVRRLRDAAHLHRRAGRALPDHRQARVRQPDRAAPAAPARGAVHHRGRAAAEPGAHRRAHRQLARPQRAGPGPGGRAARARSAGRGARAGRRGRRRSRLAGRRRSRRSSRDPGRRVLRDVRAGLSPQRRAHRGPPRARRRGPRVPRRAAAAERGRDGRRTGSRAPRRRRRRGARPARRAAPRQPRAWTPSSSATRATFSCRSGVLSPRSATRASCSTRSSRCWTRSPATAGWCAAAAPRPPPSAPSTRSPSGSRGWCSPTPGRTPRTTRRRSALPASRVAVAPVGALPEPRADGAARELAPGEPLTVLQYGKWSPLHGADVVLGGRRAAARRAVPLRAHRRGAALGRAARAPSPRAASPT